MYCTQDMCPVKIHWHVKTNYKEYWRVKVTITNRDFGANFSNWTLALKHPNFNNLTEAFSYKYKALNPYGAYSSKSSSRILFPLFLLYFPGIWQPLAGVLFNDLFGHISGNFVSYHCR